MARLPRLPRVPVIPRFPWSRSFARSPAARPRAVPLNAYAIFLIQSGVTTFANTVNFTVLAVYYVTVVHMDPLQLVLVGTVLEGTMLLLQVPTGVLADVYSRRLAVIAGAVLIAVGCFITGSIPLVAAILIAEAIRGVGESFGDGAREAWIAGEIGEEQLAHAFTRAAQVRQFVGIVAIVVSVALASIDLRLPVLVAGMLHLGLAAFLIVAMPERTLRREQGARREHAPLAESWVTAWRDARAEVSATLRAGFSLVRRTRLLLAFLALALVLGAASEGIDRLWEAHILLDFTLPGLGQLQPVVWFGVIQLALAPFEIVGLELVRRRARLGQAHDTGRTLVVFVALQAVGVLAFALAGNFFLAVAAFGIADCARTLAYPLRTAWLTRSIKPSVRATVLSLSGQSDALGQVLGGPGVGAVGNWISLRAALACSGLLLLPAVPLYMRMMRAATHDDTDLLRVPGTGYVEEPLR